jgi:hypothetical protein
MRNSARPGADCAEVPNRNLAGASPPISGMGPIASFWPSADHFRSSPGNGHRQADSARPKSAIVDGSGLAREIFTSQAWSVLPCVRPLGAVHMTAGHNALRGSGPGQKHAFDDAVAQWVVLIAGSTGSALRAVRPPNRHIMPGARRDLVTAQARRVVCNARPWPSWPRPSAQSCWQAQWRQPSPGAALTTPPEYPFKKVPKQFQERPNIPFVFSKRTTIGDAT